MDSTQAPKSKKERDQSGIALFMVIAAISVLSVLVTEFTYIAQVNQTIAYDGLDQLQAHYLAKSGFKLSLLRLKAFLQVKNYINGATGGKGISAVPQQALNKIWSFPFVYPIPTNIPGLSMGDKDRINKFQKNSGLQGNFSAIIESESSKYNLNSILAPFASSAAPSPSPSPNSGAASNAPPGTPNPNPNASPSPSPTFDPAQARQSLQQYLNQILVNKMQSDSDFASQHDDFRMDDFMDALTAWADPTYEKRNSSGFDDVGLKRGPFYSLGELHMIPPMEDDIYNLFAPSLTVSMTPGININTMNEDTLRALVPQMTPDEASEMIKFRDSEDQDNSFKSEDDFFKYLQTNVGAFRNSQAAVDDLRQSLQKQNIRLVTDETQFKITVQAHVNQSTRTLEAWVSLGPQAPPSTNPSNGPNPNPSSPPLAGPGMLPNQPGAPPGTQPVPDPGLRITFMRVI